MKGANVIVLIVDLFKIKTGMLC